MTAITPLAAMHGTLESMAEKFTDALPPQIDAAKFISVAKTTLTMNPSLLNADKTSLLATFMKAAQDGLLLDGKEAAAVKYGNSIQYLPMLEGVLKTLHNSGLIKTISAEVVYEKDLFDYELGSTPKITHKPLITGDRGKPVCVYSVATTTNGGEYYEVMNMDDINKCRGASKSSSHPSSPWVNWFDQMAKKTVIHRIAKRLPKNDAINSVLTLDDDTDFKQPVNVTPTPDKQDQPLSRLKEAMGMDDAGVDKAREEVLKKYKGEE